MLCIPDTLLYDSKYDNVNKLYINNIGNGNYLRVSFFDNNSLYGTKKYVDSIVSYYNSLG